MEEQEEDLETLEALEEFCGATIPLAKGAPKGQLQTICMASYKTPSKPFGFTCFAHLGLSSE